MAVRFGTDGTVYCNTVRYNYKQCRNIVGDSCLGELQNQWSFSGNAAISTSATGQYKAYRSISFPAGSGTPMATQTSFAPTAGHKYYGGLMWKTTGSSFSASDNRFEWYCADSSDGTMVFANKNVATNGNWVKLSSIKSLSSVRSGTWTFRNFLVNPSTASYCTKMIVIDLTDTFGSGNEPTKEWCDENILEWEKICNFGCKWSTVTSWSADPTIAFATFTSNSHITNSSRTDLPIGKYLYASLASWAINYNEVFIRDTGSRSMTKGLYYYLYLDVQPNNRDVSYVDGQNFQVYWKESEPNWGELKNLSTADIQTFNGGGGMSGWKRYSFFGTAPFDTGSYPVRIDLDNNKSPYWALDMLCPAGSEVDSNVYQYNKYEGTGITSNDVNRWWCDRWIEFRGHQIIHIKDHQNKMIKFNTAYDIVCNDIEIRPELDRIIMDSTGTIKCKALVKAQQY